MYVIDIEYPQHLQDHNDIPFLPNGSILSGSKIRKFMAALDSRERFIAHYRNLKQAMETGFKVRKVMFKYFDYDIYICDILTIILF